MSDLMRNHRILESIEKGIVNNAWSPEARAAASAARKNKGKRKSQFTVTGYGGLDKKKNQYTSFKRVKVKASDSKEAVAKAKLVLPDTHHGSLEAKEGARYVSGFHRGRVHR